MSEKKRVWKRDAVLIAVLLALTAAAFLWMGGRRGAGTEAVVCVSGQEIGRYALSRPGTYPLNGGTNLLEIRDGTAAIIEADCPDGLCIHQGKIRYNGQCITCLPNRLTVTIEGGEGGADLTI